METEFQTVIDEFKNRLKDSETANQRAYNEFEETFNKLVANLLRAMQEMKKGSRSPTASMGGNPIGIGDAKQLLGKLKSLIPERWWSGRLRDILDKVLENLSPNNPQEVDRLLIFVKEVFIPALGQLREHWRRQMTLEAYEQNLRLVLQRLLERELPIA